MAPLICTIHLSRFLQDSSPLSGGHGGEILVLLTRYWLLARYSWARPRDRPRPGGLQARHELETGHREQRHYRDCPAASSRVQESDNEWTGGGDQVAGALGECRQGGGGRGIGRPGHREVA